MLTTDLLFQNYFTGVAIMSWKYFFGEERKLYGTAIYLFTCWVGQKQRRRVAMERFLIDSYQFPASSLLSIVSLKPFTVALACSKHKLFHLLSRLAITWNVSFPLFQHFRRSKKAFWGSDWALKFFLTISHCSVLCFEMEFRRWIMFPTGNFLE